MTTVAEWLYHSPLPKLEARMLLQEVTGLSRTQLITHDEQLLENTQIEDLATWQQRRLNGEPMAYILGKREFYGRCFAVNPSVLIPRPETEHLVEAVLAHLPRQGRMWDIGTGSGIIAITVALERADAHVCASDISETALRTAKENAATLGANITFAQGSWFDVVPPLAPPQFDIVVSNPPYIDSKDEHLGRGDLRFEPQQALTDFSDGLSCLKTLSQQAHTVLKPYGWLMMEHGFDQAAAVREMLAENGFADIQSHHDLAGHERLTIGRLAVSNA